MQAIGGTSTVGPIVVSGLVGSSMTYQTDVNSATVGKTQEYYRTRDQRNPGDPLNDPDDQERGFKARQTLDTLRPFLGDYPTIESAHPSPRSADRGFFGSKPFSRANAALVAQGSVPVDWSLT